MTALDVAGSETTYCHVEVALSKKEKTLGSPLRELLVTHVGTAGPATAVEKVAIDVGGGIEEHIPRADADRGLSPPARNVMAERFKARQWGFQR
jgi:hypothetical protein